MSKQVFNISPDTGELLSVMEADESPLEPGVFLLPAFATFDEPPPQQDGLVSQFKDGAWLQVVDTRGPWYGVDHAPIVVEELDSKFSSEGLTRTPPPGPFYDLVDDAWVLNEPVKVAHENNTFKLLLQAHLDKAAQERGFQSIIDAVSYADEPAVPQFQNDGKVLREWRSLVWECYGELMAVREKIKKDLPSFDDFLKTLPRNHFGKSTQSTL